MQARDWLQIKSELDVLRPGADAGMSAAAIDQNSAPIGRPKAEDALLKHIADALRPDEDDAP